MMTGLSIIIPVYNRVMLVAETLASISNQTFKDFECIIVDDNSTDGTWEFLISFCRKDERFRCYLKSPDLLKGPSSSRNYGAGLAVGEYLHFYDSDDTLDLDFYEKCIGEMKVFGAEFLAVRLRWFSSEDAVGQFSSPFTDGRFIEKTILRQHDIWTANVIWRRDFIGNSPGFDESLTMSEDILFAVRGMKKAKNFLYDNSMHVNIRRHSQSLTYKDTPERNITRQESVFKAYYLIYQELSGSRQREFNEAIKYCMVRLYVSLSELHKMKVLGVRGLRRYLVVLTVFAKNQEWYLLLKALTLLPLKLFIGGFKD